MLKEVLVGSFEALPRNLPGETEENYEHPLSGQLVFGPIFEPVISRIRSRIANCCHVHITAPRAAFNKI
jgi:hypothetical protein